MTYTDSIVIRTVMRVRLCLKSSRDYTGSMKNILLGAGVVGALLIGGYFLFSGTESKLAGKETPVSSNAKGSLDVSKFYDGSEGWSISVPTGNKSVCTWTYAGGSGAIPYIDTTRANTATEKHALRFEYGMDFLYDFKVTCTDDFGNEYIGKFPI